MPGRLVAVSIALLSSVYCLYAQQASLAGTAVNAVTQEPMAKVHLRLVLQSPADPPTIYGAMSDSAGRFSIADLVPGTYTVMPERAGFLGEGPPTLTLKAGERLANFSLAMKPESIISGRVMDENGDGVPGVRIEAVGADKAYGGSGQTDDRGDFRLRITPGKYRLRATPQTATLNGVPVSQIDDDAAAVYGTTWYPGVRGEDRARALEAAPGRELAGNDIHLLRIRTLALSGRVIGIRDKAAPAMVEANSSTNEPGPGPAIVTPDGRFAFPEMQPGVYRLSALSFAESPRMQSQPLEVRLENNAVANVELTLLAGEDVTGTLQMPGDLESLTVLLEPVSHIAFDMPQIGGDVAKDGAFRIRDVFPGTYRVRVEQLPGNSYIKEVRVNGNVIEGTADLSAGVHGTVLRVTVSPNGGQISGTVEGSDGAASVLLVSNPGEIQSHEIFPAAPDGKYEIHGVKPGKYRLFAVRSSLYEQHGMESLKGLAGGAQEIEIAESAKVVKTLKLAPQEDSNAKP